MNLPFFRNFAASPHPAQRGAIKFNEQIGNPSQMGLLLHYLNAFESIDLKELFNRIQESNLTGEALKDEFYALLVDDNKAFTVDYINQRIAWFVETSKRTKDSIEFSIVEKRQTSSFSVGMGQRWFA